MIGTRRIVLSTPSAAPSRASPQRRFKPSRLRRAAGETGVLKPSRQEQLNLSGVWVKDMQRSDAMDAAMDLVQLNGLIRRAVGLVRGVEIQHTAADIRIAVFSAVPMFKIVERYPLDGSQAVNMRRDLRSGSHKGNAQLDEAGTTLVINLQWGDPVAGQGVDYMWLPAPDTLHIRSTVAVEGREAQYLMVYNRKG